MKLSQADTFDINRWSRHTIDLAKIVKLEPGAIYRVLIHATLDEVIGSEDMMPEKSYWGSYYGYSNSSDYYEYDAAQKNLLASDLGLLVKRGPDGDFFFSVSDIKTAKPMHGVKLELLNYQTQTIAHATTGREGWARIHTDKNAVPPHRHQRQSKRLPASQRWSISIREQF